MANERDFIWQQQGASSFVKIKMDWARFGKIHFSFVQHSGKPACKQVASIEAALKVDGGDGALYLAEAVKNNTMERRRAKALEDQKASGAKYPAPMFTSMGGTTAQRSKTGQCVFRQVSLVPGMKTDYALQVVEADGEPTATGGISMKKGAQVTRITVGLKREELLSMASAILMAWQAYMIASSAYGTLGAKSYADVQDADVPDAAANRQMPVKVVTTTASTAWVVYDSLGETFEVAVSHDAAILCVQESIRSCAKPSSATPARITTSTMRSRPRSRRIAMSCRPSPCMARTIPPVK